jgi:hypothetical protein
VTRERGGEAKTKVKPGALVRLVLDVEGEIGGGLKRSEQVGVERPLHHIEALLEHAGRGYGKIVVVVDDLDKREPREIRQVLDEAKALLRGGRCRFVFTGRALVAPADDFSPLVLELFKTPIRLGPLAAGDLKRSAVGQLNLLRGRPEESFRPFTDECVEVAVQKSHGIPRLFNRLCEGAIKYALAGRVRDIDALVFNASLAAYQQEVVVNVPYEHRRLLSVILPRGGVSVSKDAQIDDLLREAGVGRLWDLMPVLDELVKRDLLYVTEEEGGRPVFRGTVLAELAARVGTEG